MWHAGQMPPLICGRAEVREEVRELLLGSSVFVWVFFFLQGSLSLSLSVSQGAYEQLLELDFGMLWSTESPSFCRF